MHICCIHLLHLRIIQHTLINGELNGLRCWPSPQVIHSCLQTFLPPIKVHACQLPKCWGLQMNVHALTLADESSMIHSEVDYLLLADLPDSFVDCFDIVRDSRDVLDGSIVGNGHVLHVVIP